MSSEEPSVIESLAKLCKELGVTILVQVGAQDSAQESNDGA